MASKPKLTKFEYFQAEAMKAVIQDTNFTGSIEDMANYATLIAQKTFNLGQELQGKERNKVEEDNEDDTEKVTIQG